MVDGEVLLTTLASAPIISNQQCHRMRYSFTWGREERVLRKMWFVFGLIHPTAIPTNAFYERKKLAEVELCEGLVEIGHHSFYWCERSITKINVPNSLRRIRDGAFNDSLRTPIRLHDGIEIIGTGAFVYCIFTNFRVPPLIIMIPESMLSNCRAMFSLELSENMREIRWRALRYCHCLRNVAFPLNAVFGDDIFIDEDNNEMTDLQRLFGSNARSVEENAVSHVELMLLLVTCCHI